MNINSGDNWYALFVATGEEDRVKERLAYRLGDNFNILVPKRKLRERRDGKWFYNVRTLFPGYVLVNGLIDVNSYNSFSNIPGLLKLLRSGYEPLTIDQREIKVLKRLICNSEIIGSSDILLEDDKVVVVDGPLVSMEGYIINVDRRKGRAKVRMNFIGEERIIELGVSILQPA